MIDRVHSRVELALPPHLTLQGMIDPQRSIWVYSPGKPPKRRWNPGDVIRHEGHLYEIIYCYRLISNEHEWLYACESRESAQRSAVDHLISAGAGSQTPRVVTSLFQDGMQAWTYFSDIPLRTDRVIFSNQKLTQATLIHPSS